MYPSPSQIVLEVEQEQDRQQDQRELQETRERVGGREEGYVLSGITFQTPIAPGRSNILSQQKTLTTENIAPLQAFQNLSI